MLGCCEIALTMALTNLCSLAIFAGYTIRLKNRTWQLEKKNGQETTLILSQQEQINQLKQAISKLKPWKKPSKKNSKPKSN